MDADNEYTRTRTGSRLGKRQNINPVSGELSMTDTHPFFLICGSEVSGISQF